MEPRVQTYSTTFFDDTFSFRGDFSNAASPIELLDENGEWFSWGRQVADFRHDSDAVFRELFREYLRSCGEDLDNLDFDYEIEKAISQQR